MPWTPDRYPPAMQRLAPEIRSKASEAYAQLGCVKTLHIVPGATHLFEEPGTLEQVAVLAADWFVRWLRARDRALDG